MKKPLGQSLTEYGLIMGLVALLCLPALLLLKDSLNDSMNGMLPAFNTNAATLPQNGNLPSVSPNIQADGGGNVTQVLDGGSNISVSASQPVSTAGANGDSSVVLANASTLIKLAAKYEKTAPALSNSIIQLGELGKQLAQTLAKKDFPGSTTIWQQFVDLYGKIVQNDASYGLLSTSDQALVKSLTNQSSQLASNYIRIGYDDLPGLDPYDPPMPTSSSITSSSTQIDSNSNQTVQCGQNLKCD